MASTLLSESTENGSSDSYELQEASGCVAVSGTFDGATVAIEMSVDGTTFITADEVTEASIKSFKFMKKGEIRATISDAGASTSLTVKVREER